MTKIENQFDKAFYSVGLVSKVAFDNSQSELVSALQDVKKTLNAGEITANSKKDRLDLANVDTKKDKRRFELSIVQKRAIIFGLESGFLPEERLSMYSDVIASLMKTIELIPAALEYIDKKTLFTKKTIANPEAAFAGITTASPLFQLIGKRKIYNFRPEILFPVNDDRSMVCRLEFSSNIPAREVDAGFSEKDNTAEIACSVGRMSGLDEISNITDAVKEHVDRTRKFVSEDIVNGVVQPFLGSLKELEECKGNA